MSYRKTPLFPTALAVAIALGAGGDVLAAKLDPKLDALLGTATSATRLEVIVTFPGEGAPTAQQVGKLSALGLKGVTLGALPMAGVLATPAQVRALAQDDDIRSVYWNAPLEYDNEGATELTGVDRLRRDGSMRTAAGLPYTGKGVGVVINDSGVDGTHRDLQYPSHVVQNVLAQVNLHAQDALLPVTYQENVPQTDIGAGHGTHVAGIVGGTGAASAGGRMEGVAPGASLIGYGSGAALFILDSIGGFDYALTHQSQYGIRVISNSFGNTSDTGTAFDPDDPTNVATKRLADRGVVVVFSAGNAGSGEGTITGNFKKAPWVVAVAAGDKQGRLATFSSRGEKGRGGAVEIDGESYTWEDRPTVTAPGVGIYSARDSLSDGLGALALQEEIEEIGPAEAVYYTKFDGTSMAAPHVSGIVALMLEANPQLGWREVKQILQDTATNIPGQESWEAGAGYVNAHAAVRAAKGLRQYPETVNLRRTFNANAQISIASSETYGIDFSPLGTTGSQSFEVGSDIALVTARANVGENTVAIVLTDPLGNRYGSSIALPVLGQNIATSGPGRAGTWTVTVRGVGSVSGTALDPLGVTNGYGVPGTVDVTVKQLRTDGYTGLSDVSGHAGRGYIELAVRERLVDSDADGRFRPDAYLTRGKLADFALMGTGVRQAAATPTLADIGATSPAYAFAAATLTRGGALQDQRGVHAGVLAPHGGRFDAAANVTREELAYSLVQALGLETAAKAFSGDVTVSHDGKSYTLTDQGSIAPAYRGYVQYALNLNLLPARYTLVQGPFEPAPKLSASFGPTGKVTRADYAAAATRYLDAFQASAQ